MGLAAAEVAAALHVGHRRASGQMRIAVALRDRLPTVAALHLKGALSPRVVSAITWCTHLVEDEQALALIDAAVADRATRWGPLSEDKLRQAIEVWVGRYDPAALRRTHVSTRSRDLSIGACDDDTDTTALWGRLLATDAAVLQRRVTAMANGVCEGDPRSIGERRADALGALANGNQHLACACGSPACPVAGQPPKSHVVIRVIAEQAAVERGHQEVPGSTNPPPSPALLLGHGVLPIPLLAEAIRTGATDQADPDARRRARAAVSAVNRAGRVRPDARSVLPLPRLRRARRTVRHRPCPALAVGPTHASNLNCKCRHHHLMKTFCTGIGGWTDVQLPDGTLIWTSPSGTKYTTKPGSRLFFPGWNTTTAALPPPTTDPPLPPTPGDRGLMMPRRKRTRTADDTARIKTERALNKGDPPPF